MEGISYTELEIDLYRVAWSDCSHQASDVSYGIARKYGVFLQKTFKVNSIVIEMNLSEGEFREYLTPKVLRSAGIDEEL